MTAQRRGLATLLTITALLALGAAGCGSDDESPEVTVPTISVPDGGTETAPQTTTLTTPTDTTPTAPDSGDTGGTGSFDPNQDDSEANDKPPEPGSAAEKFEQACKENPAACG